MYEVKLVGNHNGNLIVAFETDAIAYAEKCVKNTHACAAIIDTTTGELRGVFASIGNKVVNVEDLQEASYVQKY